MATGVDAVLVLLVLTNLVLLGSSRLAACIRLVAVQGAVLGALPLLVHAGQPPARALLLAAGTVALKGAVFPWLLARARREADVRREVEPYVGYSVSILAGVLALAASLAVATRLEAPVPEAPARVLPVALFGILVGLFVIVSRRKALMQVLGYLVLENGIYAFGVGFALEEPLLVEMGVLLDIFVAVFIMGIIIFRIQQEFDHIDTDRLSSLRDWTSPDARSGGAS